MEGREEGDREGGKVGKGEQGEIRRNQDEKMERLRSKVEVESK